MKIKIVSLFLVAFISLSTKSSPPHEFEYDDPTVSNFRRRLCELIAPVPRRHSIGSYVPAPTTALLQAPAIPATHIQPTIKSPALARKVNLYPSE